MNPCPRCGGALAPAAGFCGRCGTPLASPTPPVPTLATAPGPQDRRRGWLPLLLAAAGVVVSVGFALTVYQVFFATSTGAESPEEAVETMLAAMAEQDPVGALRMLDPHEVEGAEAMLASLQDKARSSGIGGKDAFVTGVNTELAGLALDSRQLSEHVYRVDVTDGRLDVTVDTDTLPDQFRRAARAELQRSSYSVDLADLWEQGVNASGFWPEVMPDPGFVVVETDGRWHVSPLATTAEMATQMLDEAGGSFQAWDTTRDDTQPVYGSDPQEAVRNLIESVSSGHVSEVVATLPEDEVGVLAAYDDTVSDVLERYDVSGDLSIERLRVSQGEEQDGLVRVYLESVELRGEAATYDGYVSGTVGLRGSCVLAADDTGDEEGMCLSEGVQDMTGIDSWYVVVRETEEGWQVDPAATAFGYLDSLVSEVSVDTALAAFGGQTLVAGPTVEDNGLLTVPLNDLGSGALRVEAEAGQVLVVRDPQGRLDSRPELLPPDRWLDPVWDVGVTLGEWEPDVDTSGSTVAFAIEQSGNNQVQLETYDGQVDNVELDVQLIDAPTIEVGDPLPQQFDEGGVAWLDLAPGWYALDGVDVSGYDYGCEVCELRGRVLVAGAEGSTLREARGGTFVDGGTSYSGVLDDYGYAEIPFMVGEDAVTIRADGDFDVVLSATDPVTGQEYDADSAIEDGELMTIYPSEPGTWTLTVDDYSDSGGLPFRVDLR